MTRPNNARDPQHVGHRQRAVAVLGIERFELDVFGVLALELLDHHLAVLGLDHDAVAFAHGRGRRHHDDVAVAVGRLHRVAGDFQRVGVFVGDRGEGDLFPAFADRETAVVEIAAGAGLGEADQRHIGNSHLAAVGDQVDEGVDLGAGGGQRLGHRFGGRPARPAFRGDALGFVEGGRVEARLLGETGGRQFGAGGQPVDGSPNLVVRERHEVRARMRFKSNI